MNLLDATVMGFSAWRIAVGAALLIVFAFLMVRSRRRKPAAEDAFDEAQEFGEESFDQTVVIAPPPGATSQQAAKPEKPSAKSSDKPAAKAPAKSAKPNGKEGKMDLTDTQRIDQLHRRLSLKAGEQADLKDLSFGRLTKFHIVLAGIEHASGRDFARIKVELGGATADCGPSVQEIGENEFLVPRAGVQAQNCSIHYMCGRADAVSYLQIQVPQVDPVNCTASIDVLHVRGRRAA